MEGARQQKDAGGPRPLPEEGLEILAEADSHEIVLSDGQTYTIGPMKMRQLREFLKAGSVIVPIVQHQLQNGGEFNFTEIMEKDGDATMQAMAVATNMTVEKLDNMMPDDFARIVAQVVVVNLDFFTRTLPRVIAEEAERVKRAIKKSTAGLTPSKS